MKVTDMEHKLPISPETWQMIDRLIAYDTTSRESNLGLIEWVRDWLKAQGVDSRLTYDATGKKANLFATIEPTIAGAHRAGIVLSGHTDVVPVDGQAWSTEPFKATLKDDRIYARGSADMKGYLGVVLGMTPRFIAAKRKAPVHFALSYDEEVGCIGVRGLIEDLVRNGIKPAGCIVGEPTSMQVMIAHKGKRAFKCCVTGREAHSALTPHGVNAIEYAARLIVYIRHIADRLRDTESRDNLFDVPFTTMQTGTIRGGTASNIVPRECEFEFEYRYLPGADPDTLEREIRDYAARLATEMQGVDAATRIAIDLKSGIPGLDMSDTDGLTHLGQALARNNGLGVGKVAYATEAGLFQKAGIPSIICGPGSINDAHRPNEFVALDQIAQCEAFMERLLVELER
jgi:acetylornithine deacetylase